MPRYYPSTYTPTSCSACRYNPSYLADKAAKFNTTTFVPKTMGELVDLVTRYEPDVIWSDGACARMGGRARVGG